LLRSYLNLDHQHSWKNCEEIVTVEKDLHTIGIIKGDELAKDSMDVRRKSQEMVIKGRVKEATDIDTLTLLVKNLTKW